jgi:hypothetical protein
MKTLLEQNPALMVTVTAMPYAMEAVIREDYCAETAMMVIS